MKNIVEKQYEYILKSFIENKIPKYIKFHEDDELDLMENYEELVNYSQSLINEREIDFNSNTYRTGKAFIFNEKYENKLIETANNSDDDGLKIHCYLSLSTLLTLQKYSKQK